MKKFILALAFLAVSVLAVSNVQAGVWDGWTLTEITSSTGAFEGVGRVQAVYVSTQQSNGTDWTVLIDSAPGTDIRLISFPSAQKKSPAVLFTSNTVNSGLLTNYKALDYGEDGALFTKGCFVYKTNASTGESNKVFIKWRQ